MTKPITPYDSPSRSERRSAGKALRRLVSRESQGQWQPTPDRPDPVTLLQAQDEGRLEHLLPIKYGRMSASPFAFLRGSAAVMAADLAQTPASGLNVQLCGDAHLANFGVFATPERQLVFDINDFDETLPGPWEWDLKRLVASAVVAGRAKGFSEKTNRKLARAMVKTYCATIQRASEARTLDVWYFHVKVDDVMRAFKHSSKNVRRSVNRMFTKARTKTQLQTLDKLTHQVDGRRRFISDPPLLVPLDELLSEKERAGFTLERVKGLWDQYLASLPPDRRHLLNRFRMTHAALRVGGVGSVGTICTIILLEGGAKDDAIILQQKQAVSSVLEPFAGAGDYDSPAERVVEGQLLMQAASDIFLGWHRSPDTDRTFYWRQLKDMKGSLDVSALDAEGFGTYLDVCAVCLARAHARTGDAASIYGYAGKGNTMAKALTEFAVAYADQTERDHRLLLQAIESGRIVAQEGI